MQAMEYLHGDLSWLIILLMTISISIGFIELLVELQRREAKARQQEMELAHANRVSALGHMSATIVHEMTQPIAAARMNALAALSFLDRQPPELGRTREALGSIVGNADRGREIIGRIRAFGKKAPPRREEFAINEAVLEVVAMTHFEAAKNQVSVRTQLSEGLPPVQGDRVQLQQVVFNLIINAVEAMRDSGEKAPQLLIKTGKGGPKEIHVSVKDSGPGITTDSIEQVFDPFYTTKSGGLGMGLSVCRSIIEAHQGRLWASAAEPKGAVFAFTVPVHADNPL